jgi:hypothetical protein
MVGTIIGETKRKAKERPKNAQLKEPKKKGRELVPLVVGNYSLTAPLMSPTCKL